MGSMECVEFYNWQAFKFCSVGADMCGPSNHCPLTLRQKLLETSEYCHILPHIPLKPRPSYVMMSHLAHI